MLEKYFNRNSSIELLRLWFMIMIVTIHAYCHGSDMNFDYLYSLAHDWRTAHHLGIFSIAKCGVTGFMFITGWYGVSVNWKKLMHFVALLLFYYIFLLILSSDGIGSILKLFHPWDEWWFVSSYITILILSPIINKGIDSLSEKHFRALVLLMIFYEYVGQFLAAKDSKDTIFLLTIYLTARYIRLYMYHRVNYTCKKILFCSTIILGGGLYFAPIIFTRVGINTLNTFFISNNNILFLIFSALLVMLLYYSSFVNKFVNYLSASTLAVYLITDNYVTREPLDTWLFEEVLAGFHGYVYIIIIVSICVVVDKLRELLFCVVNKLLSRIKTRVIVNGS